MKLSILAGFASLACVVAAAACGSSSNGGSPPGQDAGGEGGGEGGVSEGGSEGGSSGGATPYVGTVSASKTNSASNPVYALTAGFTLTSDAGASTPTCSGTQSGSCCYVPPAAGAGDAGASDAGTPSVALVSAGAIAFSDGSTAIANVSPGSNNGYAITSAGNPPNPTVKWTSGDTLTVAAAGAAVNAFTASLVTAADLVGVTPALTPAPTVPITADFKVSWTASTSTGVEVVLSTGKSGSITCAVADSAGTVTVPTALLSKFTSGEAGLITLSRTNVTKSVDGNVTVNLVSTVTAAGTAKFQ